MLLDELDLPVLPLREQMHEFVEIVGRRRVRRRPTIASSATHRTRARHHAAGSLLRARQKSKKLNQLYGSLRQ